jgi:hypothetical protein
MCFCCVEHMEAYTRFKQAIIEELPATSPAEHRLVPGS